ncbi:MAG: pantoate--beta-alanine ligase [Candidatus Omnitrophota bacterium]
MRVIRTVKQMQKIARSLQRAGKSIGLVPTMGALHEGHVSLIRACRKDNDKTIVSIFVNPIQFGPSEDFKRYPRPISQDESVCKKCGVDLVFHPGAGEMYPEGFKTYIDVQEMGAQLCGASRKGHFRGVTTVVAKLFNACMPDRAYFGQKDAQQALIIRRMVKDLNIPVAVKVMPIVREKGGLAISSRNAYLNERRKEDARVISQSLQLARRLIKKGVRDPGSIIWKMTALIESKKQAKIDYISIVDTDHLKPVKKISGDCLVAVAVWFGNTRLIDNMVIKL